MFQHHQLASSVKKQCDETQTTSIMRQKKEEEKKKREFSFHSNLLEHQQHASIALSTRSVGLNK